MVRRGPLATMGHFIAGALRRGDRFETSKLAVHEGCLYRRRKKAACGRGGNGRKPAEGKRIIQRVPRLGLRRFRRRENLVQIFNERFNTRVIRQRDGSHLKLPGKVPDTVIKMRRSQLNGIWRGITDPAVLYDHVVGGGKTFIAIAWAMERRRMGLSRKPIIVVPNHLVEQWAHDVTRLYPAANVLAADKADFERSNRRRLFARIATGDYDITIVGHSSFGFIDLDPGNGGALPKGRTGVRLQGGQGSRRGSRREWAGQRMAETIRSQGSRTPCQKNRRPACQTSRQHPRPPPHLGGNGNRLSCRR